MPDNKTVIVVIPFGVPSSGKSTIWGLIKEHIDSLPDWTCDSVSSDEIRGQIMGRMMSDSLRMSKKVAFNKSTKSAGNAYDKELRRIISRASDPEADTGSTHVIFLDKNHANDDGITKATKELVINEKNIKLKKLYLIPEMEEENLFLADLPFSANFLA